MKAFLALLIAAALAAPVGAQQLKIGYVDLQRALNESDAGKKAKEEFKVEMDKLRDGLKSQREEIENLRERMEKKALVLKDEERRKLEKDYQRRLRDFERSFKDSQAELQAKDNELTEEILRDLQEIIGAYGEREGFLLLLERANSAVLFAEKSADVTDDIIEEYNKSRGKGRKG